MNLPEERTIEFNDPISHRKWILEDTNLLVRGTSGAGDFMFTLSTAFYIANLIKEPIHVIFYWNHGADYCFHPEDPESIIEKIAYFYSRCYKREYVTYEHVFDFDVDDLFVGEMMLNLTNKEKIKNQDLRMMPVGLCSWKMDPRMLRVPTDPKKVVCWRSNFNAAVPAGWKRSYSHHDWDHAIKLLRERGYKVIVIDYRTPIREVFYHMQSSRFNMGYDGMWHYVSRMLYKPTIITGNSGIIRNHNPQAKLFFSPEKDNKKYGYDMMRFVKDIDHNIKELDELVSDYKDYLEQVI